MGEQRKRKMVKRSAKVLSPERVGRITALFRAFDYDSGGSIDAVEFGFIGQQMDPKGWTDSKSDSIIKSLDKNDDGQVSSSEFVEFFRKNGAQIRTDENFNARQDKYLAAAVRGRAEDYVKFVEKQANKLARRGQYARAAEYAKNNASTQRELTRQRRQARAAGNYFAEPEAKLMFCIRIRGMCDMHPKTKKILQLLRLRQIHLGVFLRVNKATQEMIKRVEPYLAYGYPSLKATRELIYKRGFGKVKTPGQAQRLPLTRNADIGQHLAKFGITCFEDLINEIYTVGPHFKQANNFLWPFKLNSAKGGLPKKRLGYNEGGQAGNREADISQLIARML